MSLTKRLHEVRTPAGGSSRRDPVLDELRQKIHHHLIDELGPLLYDRRLSEDDLRVRVHGVRLNIGPVLQQAIDDIHRLPDAAGDEVAEQGDVAVGHVMVGDAAVSPVADVVLCQGYYADYCVFAR